MNINLDKYVKRILNGEDLAYQELCYIGDKPDTDILLESANQIRKAFRGNHINLCAAINLKAGRCSENCKYCSQSAYYKTYVKGYGMKEPEEVMDFAEFNQKQGVANFELSTSGGALSQLDKTKLLEIYKILSKSSPLHLCGAHGLLKNEEEARQLKEAGLKTYQHNLQTSRDFFPNICTTHTYDERINTNKYAKKAGLDLCSGGIIGLGESMSDRIEMVLELRELGISSMPINILNPIEGTPYGGKPVPLTTEEVLRTIAVFRFALPNVNLIYGAGRVLMGNEQYRAFTAGLNGIVVGNFLTTKGNCISDDVAMLKEQGFEILPKAVSL